MTKKKLTILDLIITIFLFLLILFIAVNHLFLNKNKESELIIETNKEKYYYKLDSNKNIEIKTDNGSVFVEIQKGKFRFMNSTCPNKDCVKIGWVSLPNFPVVCLPNKVTGFISNVEPEYQYDGISR